MFFGKVFFKDDKWLDIQEYAEPKHSVIYEVIRLIDGIPLFWDSHIERLLHSFEMINIPLQLDLSSLKKTIAELINRNDVTDSNLRINVHYNKIIKQIISLEIGQVPVTIPNSVLYKTGVEAAILEVERPNPNVKNVWVDIRKKVSARIAEEKVWDVVLKNHFGELTEGGRTNLFFIKGEAVYTPPVHQVLPGITRMMVVKACLHLNIPVYQKPVKAQELSSYEACFFTGTSPGIIPIRSIGPTQFNVQSPILTQLTDYYKRMVEEDISTHHYSL